MSTLSTLVRGRIFNPLSRDRWEYFDNGALVVDAQGRITTVGNYPDLKQTADVGATLDFSDCLILPGLIDTHIHLPQLPIRGVVAGTLLEWLENHAFPIERAFADADYASRLSRVFFEGLKANGTTTALVLSSVHEESTHRAFEAACESGMRVIMGKVMMDRNVPDDLRETLKASVEASARLAKTWHRQNDDLLRYAFTPRFALSCTMELLEAVGDLHQQFAHSYIHSHLSENISEVQQVRALFPKCENYAEVYEQAGCLGPRAVMAHAVHLTFDEMRILRHNEARIAHCPTSNFFLKSGFFNLQAIVGQQIPVGLGTDVGAGPDLCLLRVMRAMDEMQLRFQHVIKPVEALYYGTLAGAEVLSLAEETGNLQPGKSADFIVVDTRSLASVESDASGIEETLSRLVYLGGEQNILRTYVRGQEVYRRQPTEVTALLTTG